MEVTSPIELEREIARELIVRRSALISREALRQLIPDGGEVENVLEWAARREIEVDVAIRWLPLYRVYEGEDDSEELYVFLPHAVTQKEGVAKVVEIIGCILKAVYADKEEELGSLGVSLHKIIGDIIYEQFAGWNEFATQGLAWYHAKLAKAYGAYDEVVDMLDQHGGVGAVYYRVGGVWLVERWHYCRHSRWGGNVGVQKCVEYGYVDGPE